jgi:hypothetical protein
MKIAFLLRGISGGEGKRINWTKCKDSIQKAITDLSVNNTVSVYLVTYIHPSNYDLAKFYNPVKVFLLPLNGSTQRRTSIESIKYLANEDVDVIISTRFDIEFHSDVSEWNFEWNKFNFLHKELTHWDRKFVSDLLFVFPKKYIPEFITAMELEDKNPERPDCDDLHPIYKHLVDKVDIHFIFEEYTQDRNLNFSFTRYQNNKPIYTIHRRI